MRLNSNCQRALAITLVTGAIVTTAMTRPAVSQTLPAPCADSPGDALKGCLSKHYADIDRQIADAYKAVLARAESSGLGRNLVMDWKRAIQETQRKWIAYREADCGPPLAYETSKRPELREIEQLRCKIAHTTQRLQHLPQARSAKAD